MDCLTAEPPTLCSRIESFIGHPMMASRFLKRFQKGSSEKDNTVAQTEQNAQPIGINPLPLDEIGGIPITPDFGQKSPAVEVGDGETKDSSRIPSSIGDDDEAWPEDQYV